jgi:hypothetical protein
MATLLKSDASVEPPAYALRQAERDLELVHVDERLLLHNALFGISSDREGALSPLLWIDQVPQELNTSKYGANALDGLRNLPKDSDLKPSQKLLNATETLWNSLCNVFLTSPRVVPGADNTVVFSWSDKRRGKSLAIALYDQEENLTCDFLLKTFADRTFYELPFDVEALRTVVEYYDKV